MRLGLAAALALLAATLVMLFGWVARASDEQATSVVVVWSVPSEPELNEALVRIRGELAAVGLQVTVRWGATGDGPFEFEHGEHGALELRQKGGVLEILTHSPDHQSSDPQLVDPQDQEINAEVIAVRAVEALRAQMLQYARQRQAGGETLPQAVRDFTRVEPPPPLTQPTAPTPPEPKPEPPPPKEQPPAQAPPAEGDEFGLTLLLGPVVRWDPPAKAGSGAARLELQLSLSGLSVGALGEMSVLPAKLSVAEGSVSTARRSVFGRLGWQLALTENSSASVMLGAGVAFYQSDAESALGYIARSREHHSFLGSAELAARLWFSGYLGGYLSLGAEFASDAPRLTIAGRDVATYDRPSLFASLGLVAGLR